MALSQLSFQELEKKVLARQTWFEKIIDFVGDVVYKNGIRVGYQQENSHTYTKYELNNIRGFSFMIEGSFTMFGGEGLKIWYQPPSQKDVPKQEVLHIEWWGKNSIHLRLCIDENKWLGAFKRLMKNKKKIFLTSKQRAKQCEQIEKKKQDEQFEAAHRKELMERATRMRLL